MSHEKEKPVFTGGNITYDSGIVIGRIFIPASTGIIYEVQCGGMNCNHELIEGYFIEVKVSYNGFKDFKETGMIALDCDLLCEKDFTQGIRYPDSKKDALEIIPELQRLLDFINGILLVDDDWIIDIQNGFTMQVNPDKWEKLKEGWIPIILSFARCDIPEREAFEIPEAYLHLGNCD